jgi:hypothetical protein
VRARQRARSQLVLGDRDRGHDPQVGGHGLLAGLAAADAASKAPGAAATAAASPAEAAKAILGASAEPSPAHSLPDKYRSVLSQGKAERAPELAAAASGAADAAGDGERTGARGTQTGQIDEAGHQL